VDAALGGKLDELLAGWRSEGQSYEAIARRLETEHGVVLSMWTVKRWCDETASDEAA
jgi:intein-encoded DNA endonuclease-like protein